MRIRRIVEREEKKRKRLNGKIGVNVETNFGGHRKTIIYYYYYY